MALWISLTLLVLIALLGGALFLPVRLRLRAEVGQVTWLRLDIHLLGGAAPAICLFDTVRKRKKTPKAPRKKSAAGTAGTVSRVTDRGILRLMIGLIRQFKFIWLRGKAEFGFEDPADTGAVFGVVAPLVYTGKYAAGADLDITPNFNCACISGKIDAAVEVVPLSLVPPVARFGWSRMRSET